MGVQQSAKEMDSDKTPTEWPIHIDHPVFIYIFFLAKSQLLKKNTTSWLFFSEPFFCTLIFLRQFLQYYCCSLNYTLLYIKKKNNNLFDVDSIILLFFSMK